MFYGRDVRSTFNDGTMDVSTKHPVTGATIIYNNMALPANGVIYVEQGRRVLDRPARGSRLQRRDGCAILTVDGTYAKSMTLGSADDILIDGDLTA